MLVCLRPLYYHADAQPSQALGPLSEEDGAGEEKSDSLAVYLDKKLEVEFKNEEIASQTKTDLNETLSKEKVRCMHFCGPD